MGIPVTTSGISPDLVGRSAQVIVTDPWEFITDLGTEPLVGRVKAIEDTHDRLSRIVVDLLTPVNYHGVSIVRFDATPRHRDSPTVGDFSNGAKMPANIEGVSADPAKQAHPFAFLGEIRLA